MFTLSNGRVKKSAMEGSMVMFWKKGASCCLGGMTANILVWEWTVVAGKVVGNKAKSENVASG